MIEDPDPTLPADSLSATGIGLPAAVAGAEESATALSAPPAPPAHAAISASALPAISGADLGERYDLGPILGRGGMGEVRLARDTRIDREVAVKLMHEGARDELSIARFFREARVQGALEHPAVVPVHDLGIDGEGHPYFVMKKLAGASLYDVLAKGSIAKRTLLARLVDVCLAIELAHTRGVVHRDLKPANIMLGDFGEVYVLDWGLARIVGDSDLGDSVGSVSGDLNDLRAAERSGGGPGKTVAGALLGTPGYMSPEQARGEEVDAATDIYALGCILYEIVVGAAAMPRGLAAIEVALSAECHRPSRAPELGGAADAKAVPPELDDLCARATAADRTARPTARALADAIQAFLDGDRDHAQRTALSAAHSQRAQDLFDATERARGVGTPPPPGSHDARGAAVREAGRALALDPDNAQAARLLARAMLAAPGDVPPAALAAADDERGRIRKRLLVNAAVGFAAMGAMTPTLLLFTVRAMWPILGLFASFAALTAATFLAGRRVLPMKTPWFFLVMSLMTLMLFMLGLIFGPLLLLPIFLTGSVSAWLVIPVRYSPVIVLAFHAAAIVPLFVLEHYGVIPSTFSFEAHGIVFQPWVIDLTPGVAAAMYAIALLAQTGSQVNMMGAFKRIVEDAQDRRHAQAWHLEQLLPPSH